MVVLRKAFTNGDEEDMLRLRTATRAIKTTANISSGIGRLYSICEKLLSLTEEHLRERRANETCAAGSDNQSSVGDYDFVAVMEDTENVPLFMDSWETFLNLEN